jgi:predicted PurR-regulated permease PerM
MTLPEKHTARRPIQPAEKGDRHLWEIRPVRDFFIIFGLGFLLWSLYLLRGIFFPVFLALVLAQVVNPFVTRLEQRWRWPRPLTVGLLLAVVMMIFVGFLAWFGPLLLQQFTALARRLPDYLRTVAATYNVDLGNLVSELDVSIRELQTNPQEILGHIFRTTGRAVGILTFVFSTAAYFTFTATLTLIYFFFFSWRFNAGIARLKKYIPQRRKDRICAIAGKMDTAVGDFFRGRLVIAILMGVLFSGGWFLAGVPYWFFLGMLTGFLNIVPYLSIISWPVAILVTYVDSVSGGSGQSPGVFHIVVWPSAVYILVQLVEGWVLTPWIQSGQTNMNAATILLVVFIGGALAGVWGLLFAIPVAACIKIFLDEVVLPGLRDWAASH